MCMVPSMMNAHDSHGDVTNIRSLNIRDKRHAISFQSNDK